MFLIIMVMYIISKSWSSICYWKQYTTNNLGNMRVWPIRKGWTSQMQMWPCFLGPFYNSFKFWPIRKGWTSQMQLWPCFLGHFTLGVRANVQPKSSIPIGAKIEISPKGFALGVKVEIEKKTFQFAPSTNKCWALWPWIGPRLIKGYHQIWEANLQRLKLMF